MKKLSLRERGIRQKLMTDFPHYARKCLWVRGKRGDVTPLDLNPAQVYLHQALEQQKRETGRVRALVLKGRQQGCSTYVAARFFWRITHRRGARGFILTHLEEATRNLYQIVRRFHENCPGLVRPHTSHSNAKELIFDKLDSGYSIGTARSQGTGRSNTIQFFHGSEVAYWENAHEHVAGALQAVPDMPGTEVVLESTSAGATGLFYQMCKEALRARSEYKLIFLPWFWQPEYRKEPPVDFVLNADEQHYKQTYQLSDAQIYWRRLKIAELGSVWSFRREYPATAQEAFQADRQGALWTRARLHKNRVELSDMPEFKRVVIAVDPAVSAHAGSDETGIIVAALGVDDHGYIVADLSGKYSPAAWAQRVANAYYQYGADRVVAEVNQGGDMVEHTLRTIDPTISYRAVHASRGKYARAEPVAALDEQGRVHHGGQLTLLEDQMCSYEPGIGGKSPDRVDARTWAITELMLGQKAGAPIAW